MTLDSHSQPGWQLEISAACIPDIDRESREHLHQEVIPMRVVILIFLRWCTLNCCSFSPLLSCIVRRAHIQGQHDLAWACVYPFPSFPSVLGHGLQEPRASHPLEPDLPRYLEAAHVIVAGLHSSVVFVSCYPATTCSNFRCVTTQGSFSLKGGSNTIIQFILICQKNLRQTRWSVLKFWVSSNVVNLQAWILGPKYHHQCTARKNIGMHGCPSASETSNHR
jgi:hypothetical protein